MIRYGSGVWSDHRRGMFHGATKRQDAITTGTGYAEGAVLPSAQDCSLAQDAPLLAATTKYTVSINCVHATSTQGVLLCRAMNHGLS